MPDEQLMIRFGTILKGGDVYMTTCGDYHGISVLSAEYKILSSIVNKRLYKYFEDKGLLEDEQAWGV